MYRESCVKSKFKIDYGKDNSWIYGTSSCNKQVMKHAKSSQKNKVKQYKVLVTLAQHRKKMNNFKLEMDD